jgi:hypothetical protein
MSGVHEYAFDVKLAAVIRVWATSEDKARSGLFRLVDALDLMVPAKDREASVLITEASMHDDENWPHLFELDGEEID